MNLHGPAVCYGFSDWLCNCFLSQRGRRGHSSVEDAQAALDLYKLVEGEWEHELQTTLRDDDSPVEPSYASSSHYMNDQYWPDDVIGGRQ